jgi:2-polyprenyl-3-methyl-5-hydroxy-6-metoxy-1,4-benzoquinol methylase
MTDFDAIPCPLCAASTYDVVYPGKFPETLSHEFLTEVYRSSSDQALFEQVVKCRECGVVYLNPRLRSNLIVSSYADGEDRTFIEQDAFRIRTFTEALKKLRDEYGLLFSPETKTLDIGCAGGAFLRAARECQLSAIGIEPSRFLGDYARTTHNLDVRSGVLADFSFPAHSFDLITLWDVIEHVPDPKEELRTIQQLLKPDGLFVVNYPDFGSLPAKLLGRKWPFLLSVHLVYYTPETIRRQLLKSGFRVIGMKRHWQTLELGYVIKRASQYFSGFRFLGFLTEKLGLATLPIKYWIGQTQVIAKRYDTR